MVFSLSELYRGIKLVRLLSKTAIKAYKKSASYVFFTDSCRLYVIDSTFVKRVAGTLSCDSSYLTEVTPHELDIMLSSMVSTYAKT